VSEDVPKKIKILPHISQHTGLLSTDEKCTEI
jgi:hypothetical protein